MQSTEVKPKVLIPRSNGVSAFEAFQHAKKEGSRILSNKEHDKILVETEVWNSVKAAYAVWTGTMTAYTSPSERLGSEIKYQDSGFSGRLWRMPVPVGFRALKNSILVVEHPNYDLEINGDEITVIVSDDRLKVVENFATEMNKWYAPDPNFSIPTGNPIEYSRSARYLWRLDKRIGPIVRGDYSGYHYGRGVDFDEQPSSHLGVLVEEKEVITSEREIKLRFAERIAPYAATELKKLAESIDQKSIENLSELIRILTRQ